MGAYGVQPLRRGGNLQSPELTGGLQTRSAGMQPRQGAPRCQQHAGDGMKHLLTEDARGEFRDILADLEFRALQELQELLLRIRASVIFEWTLDEQRTLEIAEDLCMYEIHMRGV